MNVINFIIEHWGKISFCLAFIAYILTHQKVSIEYAKKTALTIMLSLETNAEKYMLETGLDKLEFVILHGYNLLPRLVRVFVSKGQFEIIIQELFDKAREYAESHKKS